MSNNLNKELNEYICTVCARPQPSNQIRHGGLCCNACAAFFQRTIFMEPSLKCKRNNSCFNSQTTMISSCRKCRYTKCLEVGMPYPKITTVTAFTLTQEEALICAHTIHAFLTTCESNPRLLESSFDKEILEIFNHSLNAAKKLAEKTNEIPPGKIQALAQLLFTNPISMDGGLYQICYISICKLKFRHVQASEKEKVTQLQNDAYLKLENQKMNVAVLVIVEREYHLNLYKLAQKSLECYCKIYNYNFVRIILENSPELVNGCFQKDFMFRRHCVTVNFLTRNPTIEYVLFVDADMGIINPNHKIEEYIDPKYDMLFYERIYDYEIVAGSFLIKNTHYARQFLETWSNFEPKLPKSFHGSDNAALHQIFLNYFDPQNEKMGICQKIWNASTDWEGVFDYVACARSLLNDRLIFERIKILSKTSRSSWARDGWLTNSTWSSKDFMLHGWKSTFLDQPGFFASWTNPFVPHIKFRTTSQCESYTNPFKDWKYNPKYKKHDEDIRKTLEKISKRVRNEYNARLKKIWYSNH